MMQPEFINLTTIGILMTFKNVMTFNCRKKAHVNTACMSFLSTAYFSRNKGVTGSVLRTYYALHTYHTKPRNLPAQRAQV